MLLSEIVAGYMTPAPAGLMLDVDEVSKQLKRAVTYLAGWTILDNFAPVTPVVASPVTATSQIDDPDIDLTAGEWASIKRLFELYVEHENAMMLEASRSQGADVFGRAVSEIQSEIAQTELDLRKTAYYQDGFTV